MRPPASRILRLLRLSWLAGASLSRAAQWAFLAAGAAALAALVYLSLHVLAADFSGERLPEGLLPGFLAPMGAWLGERGILPAILLPLFLLAGSSCAVLLSLALASRAAGSGARSRAASAEAQAAAAERLERSRAAALAERDAFEASAPPPSAPSGRSRRGL